MRLSGRVVVQAIFAYLFPTLILAAEPIIPVLESAAGARVVVEGWVLDREIKAAGEDRIEYLFYIEQTGGDTSAEVFVARCSTAGMLGSLVEGRQVVVVLDPLPDGTFRLIDGIARTERITSSTQAFPGAGPENLVDGLMDLSGNSWAAGGFPNWVEIDLGQTRLITEISVAPSFGSPIESYYYNAGWTVQYRDGLGQLRDFSNTSKLLGAGTLTGPGITISNADPATTSPIAAYRHYDFRFDPVSTRYVRYTVTSGDRDGNSNGAELEIHQAFQMGTPVTFDASIFDAEDGDLSTSTTWSSNLGGILGTGASITVSTLSIGIHTITALTRDRGGSQSTSTTQVTIVDSLSPTYPMTTATTGSGSGTLSSSPSGIDCGADCSETFDEDTFVALTATPSRSSRFAGWSGHADCSDGQITMSSDRACIATFDLLPPVTDTVPSSHADALSTEPVPTVPVESWNGDLDCSADAATMDADRPCTTAFALATSNDSPALEIHSPTVNPAERRPVLASGNAFPNASAENVVDGALDVPDSAWAAAGAPNWVEIDLGDVRMLDRVAVAPFIGSPGTNYYYDNGWTVQYRDSSGNLRDFSNVIVLTGAGTLVAPGIRITDGDPGSALSIVAYKFYELGFDPVALRYLRFTVTDGDVDNDSNAAEIRVREVWRHGESIALAAIASDPQDGDLTNGIVWSSSLDGILGTGGTLDVDDLAVGDHTILALATDSQGATASQTVTVKVISEAIPFFSLNVSIDGSGVVTSSPPGIDCGTDCAGEYEESSTVALTATPGTGWSFVEWAGDPECSDGLVVMNTATVCTASFEPQSPDIYVVTVAKVGTGSGSIISSPAGIDCGLDCNEAYDEGTVVALTAVPDNGSRFAGWSGGTDCSDGHVTLIADQSCTAEFELLPQTSFSLTVSRTGSGSGTVTSSPVGIDCGSNCREVYVANTRVTLTATPDQGSAFVEWSGHPDCTDGVVEIVANRSCNAVFDVIAPADHHTLSVSIGGAGSGTIVSAPAGIDCGSDCIEFFAKGTPVTLDARPAPNSRFVGWSGSPHCKDGRLAISGDRACGARFELEGSLIHNDGLESDDISNWTNSKAMASSGCKIN